MSANSRRRHAIFNRFANNLQLLTQNGILTGLVLQYERTYICPICQDQFSYDALNQASPNPLTLEDVPPKSLGGRANILTCRQCNNLCGYKIDYHLTQRMRELDHSQFLPRADFAAQFEYDGRVVQGRLRVEDNGNIIATHETQRNHPKRLETFVKSLLPQKVINVTFLRDQVDPFKLQLALLKVGFLSLFAKYGYAFILHPVYNGLRQQLLNPDNQTYPTNFWFQESFLSQHYGVPFITENGLEAVLSIFPLRTTISERPFATIIPLPIRPIEGILAELNNRFNNTPQFAINMDGMNANYLTDIQAVNVMLAWINGRTPHN